MKDSHDPDEESTSEPRYTAAPRYDPPEWISTEQLDTDLLNAIIEDTPRYADEDIDDYDDGFDESLDVENDEEDDEEEHRRSTFTLLVGMRPLLGELLGGPSATETISEVAR